MTDISVSSLTYAIKGQRLLEQNGDTVWAGRDHDRVTGCGYKLTIRGGVRIRVSGAWKTGTVWVKAGGVWKRAKNVWRNSGGSWKRSI